MEEGSLLGWENSEKSGTVKPCTAFRSDPTSSGGPCTVTASRVHLFHLTCVEIIYAIAQRALLSGKGQKKTIVCKSFPAKRWSERHAEKTARGKNARGNPRSIVL
ncbi:hypothetical protein [uncultured Oscillibacter sp.]|jgi:hypothetical protein|uniref:hypothetical protein n=1 Tax=uncultured Oscillibacter sp. TaxID=876091 RepID=UPI0025E7EFAE|nr:hypothetical protein [uncultured Oscillibacter sp.]